MIDLWPNFDPFWVLIYIGFGLFLLAISREVYLWYTGQNKIISLLEEIRDILDVKK